MTRGKFDGKDSSKKKSGWKCFLRLHSLFSKEEIGRRKIYPQTITQWRREIPIQCSAWNESRNSLRQVMLPRVCRLTFIVTWFKCVYEQITEFRRWPVCVVFVGTLEILLMCLTSMWIVDLLTFCHFWTTVKFSIFWI